MRFTALPLLLLPTLLLSMPLMQCAHARTTTNRCVGSDGTSIYTDQKCEDIGAVKRTDPPPDAIGNGNTTPGMLRTNTCARRPEDLLNGIKQAISSGDVNQIAAYYHWPGVSSGNSATIFKRLQALVEYPLLSINIEPAPTSPDESGDQHPADESPQQAYWVQIVQGRPDGNIAPIRSVLSLHRNIGCWWLQF